MRLSSLIIAPLSWTVDLSLHAPAHTKTMPTFAVPIRRCGFPLLVDAEGLRLPLAALSAGLTAAVESAAAIEMQALSASRATVNLRDLELDEEELNGHKSRLLAELGDIEAAGVVFQADGSPSPSTLGLSLVLTARKSSELNYPSITELIATSDNAHADRANLALAAVVNDTLEEMEKAELFTDASVSASVSVNESSPEQTMEEARRMHMRWAILELARARYAEDRPDDWGN